MARRQLILHPHVFTELVRFVCVPGRADALEPKPLEKRDENLLDEIVFTRRIEEFREFLPLRYFLWRKRTCALSERSRTHACSCAAQMAAAAFVDVPDNTSPLQ